MKESNTVL